MNLLYRSHPLGNTATPMLSPACLAAVLFLAALCPHVVRAQGALTNGWTHQGNISPAGDSDTWTFTANAGDAIVIRVGELNSTSFAPKIQLLSPTSVVMASVASSVSAEIAVPATNSGTFSVIVSDNSGTFTNAYRITLAKSPGAIAVAPGDEGGPMTNGVMHTGTIGTGDLDVWTFNANSGDNLIVRMGEITDTSANFTPWVRLYGPNGALLDSGFGTIAGEVAATATNSGTFTVVAGDGNGALSGTGTYRLTLAKTGDPVVVSASDEGGPMTNGVMHTGTISSGDLDVWTFNANSGDAIVLRAGEIVDNSGNFTPWIRLYGPDGKLLDSGFGVLAGEVTATATNSGTFIAVVGDGNSALSGSGTYRLTLAKTGDPVVVSAGDEGGPMTNDVMHTGTISTGDLDVWTFTANSGDAIVVRAGDALDATGNFTPWIRLYGPNGKLLSSGFGAAAAEVTATATNSGTFIAVFGDGNSALSGAGNYRLTLARTGDPVVVSAGDEGGPISNGAMNTGTIGTGDLDMWTFNATNGDAIVVRVGEITDTNAFTPWVRLYGPNGKLLDSGFGASAGEVTATATNSGIFIAIVGDGNSALSGSGDYRLTLAKTGDPITTSPGDEGGPLSFNVNPEGTIDRGDLDLYSFTACAGDRLSLKLDELVDTSVFSPWVRLYGPTGTLLGSFAGPTTAQINVNAAIRGRYLVIVSDGNAALSGVGTYRLTANGLSDGLKLCAPLISGANANVSGVGGTAGSEFRLYTTTNVAIPFSLWTPIVTNQLDALGTFGYTNPFSPSEPQRFFRLLLP